MLYRRAWGILGYTIAYILGNGITVCGLEDDVCSKFRGLADNQESRIEVESGSTHGAFGGWSIAQA